MSTPDIIRAWTDPQYRLDLSAEECALLPDHPAGAIELADAKLDDVAGGLRPFDTWTDTGWCCCSGDICN